MILNAWIRWLKESASAVFEKNGGRLGQSKFATITSILYHEKGLRSNFMSAKSRCKLLSSRLFSKLRDTTRQCCVINTIRFVSDARDHSCSENDEATLYIHVSKYRLNSRKRPPKITQAKVVA